MSQCKGFNLGFEPSGSSASSLSIELILWTTSSLAEFSVAELGGDLEDEFDLAALEDEFDLAAEQDCDLEESGGVTARILVSDNPSFCGVE